jgi:hypothetical protein
MNIEKIINLCKSKKDENIPFKKELTFDIPFVNLNEYMTNEIPYKTYKKGTKAKSTFIKYNEDASMKCVVYIRSIENCENWIPKWISIGYFKELYNEKICWANIKEDDCDYPGKKYRMEMSRELRKE